MRSCAAWAVVVAACASPAPSAVATSADVALADTARADAGPTHDVLVTGKRDGSGADGGSPRADAHWQATPLVTPATLATVVPFALTAHGTDATSATAIHVTDGIGTWQRNGESLPLLVAYGTHFAGFDLGCGFALAHKRLVSVWLYCQAGKLAYVWQADTAGQPLEVAAATGSCQVGSPLPPRKVAVPALALAPPQLAHGFRVQGPALDLRDDATDGTSGSVRVGAVWLPAFVFEIIDCGKCGAGGWIELHLLAYDAAQKQTTAWIAYLMHAQPDQVRLGWGVRLPDLEQLPELVLAGEWTATAPGVPRP